MGRSSNRIRYRETRSSVRVKIGTLLLVEVSIMDIKKKKNASNQYKHSFKIKKKKNKSKRLYV